MAEELTQERMDDLARKAGKAVRACSDYARDFPYNETMITRRQYEAACRSIGVQPMSDDETMTVNIGDGGVPFRTLAFLGLVIADWRRRRLVYEAENRPLF